MKARNRPLAAAALAALWLTGGGAFAAPAAVTPTSILQASPAADWARLDPSNLLVIELANGRRVTIALADGFAPAHIANIKALAKAHWWDGLAIERVQDDYVTQWGDPDGKKPLPEGVPPHPSAEYERPAAGVPLTPLPYRDAYAERVGLSGPFPVAETGGSAWLTHCYGMVGVGRDLNPDAGSGAELYAVIGQPPRALDRNIAVVGRVVDGMDALSSLPRGTGDLGFYKTPGERLGIRQVRLASDLPAGERPRLEVLKPESATFAAWVHAKANRKDDFFLRPAGALDLCNALPPVRPAAPRT